MKDNSTIASGSWKEIKLWNVISGENFVSYVDNKNWVRNLVFLKCCNDEDYLVSAGNNEIKLWNLSLGECVSFIDTEDNLINCIREVKVGNGDLIVASGRRSGRVALSRSREGEDGLYASLRHFRQM